MVLRAHPPLALRFSTGGGTQLSGKEHSETNRQLDLTWHGLPTELGMPGRSQPGQILNLDDGGDTESDTNERARLAPIHAVGVEAERRQASAGQPKPAAGRQMHGSNSEQAAGQLPMLAGREGTREDESGTDTDEDGELIRAKAKAAQEKAKPAPKRRAPGKTRAGAGITLGLLIKEGIIWPGKDVLSVEYKSVMTHATLNADGQIVCKINGTDTTFESPSAFSIFLKRMVNPNRKADDGWKTVKFNGKFLETYKSELAKRRMAALGEDGDAPEMQPASKTAKLEAGSTPGGVKSEGKGQKARRKSAANGHAATGKLLTQANTGIKVGSNVEDESHMIPCERYRGEPGSSTSGSQPFRVIVSPGAALFMEFHAHLSSNEIIGLLGGTWNAHQRLLRVERAFPVEEVQTQVATPTVEMDPGDEALVRQSITGQHNLRCVGWYHSHPHAATHPSTSDIIRQIAQQRQHRVEGTVDEPFIGAIVGPFNKEAPSAQCSIAYFCVDHPLERVLPAGADPIAEGCLPMQIEVDEEGTASTEIYVTSMPQNEMRKVSQRCASSSRRVDIQATWREGVTNLEKLKASISARLPEHWPDKKVEEYLMKADAVVSAAWKFFGQPNGRKEKTEEEELEISDVTEDDPQTRDSAQALDDDATGGVSMSDPPREAARGDHPRYADQVDNYDSTFPQGSHAREELDEPAAHSYFDQGPTLGGGNGIDGYADDGFLDGQICRYRGSMGQYNDDDDISD